MLKGGTPVTCAETKRKFAKYFSEKSSTLTLDVKVL